jgi:hypothetical protein
VAVGLAACHVTSSDVITRPSGVKRVAHPEGRVAQRPTLTLTDAGGLAFVEPLACRTEEIVTEQRARQIEIGPNLATFVVGVIATAIGGVMLVSGLNDDDKSNPITFGGGALLAGGLPFAVGPWIGNGTALQPLEEGAPSKRPGPSENCGTQPLATATSATLAVRGIEVFGRIDPRGTFAVSLFAFVDAFDPGTAAISITARVEAMPGPHTLDATLDGRAFAGPAAVFLQTAQIDTKLEPIRLVPNLVPGTLRVSLTQTSAGPAARIVLAIKNDGPGPTFRLRGVVTAPGTPALDGRVVYFGHLAKGAALSRELVIPLAPATADALKNAPIELALELRDAHGTAPQTPVRFRGVMLVDAPR